MTSQAALADLPHLLQLTGEPESSWLSKLENFLSPEKLQELLRQSDPEKLDNPYFVLSCELGAFIAFLLKKKCPRLQWLSDFPYFESCLFDLNSKTLFPTFHWAIKTMSGDERHPLEEKIQTAILFLRDHKKSQD